jgi:hypothetical protein
LKCPVFTAALALLIVGRVSTEGLNAEHVSELAGKVALERGYLCTEEHAQSHSSRLRSLKGHG